MKKILAFGAAIVLALLVSGVVQAQSDPVAGTWKLNTAKSKYSGGPAPKNLTLRFETQGDGIKGSSAGTAADGSHRAWSFAANFDGKDSPISGIGPAGADTIAIKRINPTAIATTYKKAGKVVRTSLLVISKDGNIMMIKAKGPGADSKPDVLILDKQ